MPKRKLREPFNELKYQLVETMLSGHKLYRPDLDYPESHSDMEACAEAILLMFDIKRRGLALEFKDIVEPIKE